MRRPARAPLTPAAGERVLAWADSETGPVAGTRDALYVPRVDDEPLRVAWTDVEGADWDEEASRLRVREIAPWGRPRREHVLSLTAPGRLLELVRERVTATVVLSRRVPVTQAASVTLVGRRATAGEREVSWLVEYDAGLDPDDPFVALAVESALAAARAEVGQP